MCYAERKSEMHFYVVVSQIQFFSWRASKVDEAEKLRCNKLSRESDLNKRRKEKVRDEA